MAVVIYTILKRAWEVGRITSLRTPPLINSLTVGSALYVALPKTCLKKRHSKSPHKSACFFVIEDWLNEIEKPAWVGLPQPYPSLRIIHISTRTHHLPKIFQSEDL